MKSSKPLMAFQFSALLVLTSTSAFAELPADLETIIDQIDEKCAGNDNGIVYTFTPRRFDADKAMREMLAESRCADGREYSKSKEDGVAMAIEHILGSGEDAQCVKNAISPRDQKKLREMIEDSSNYGVFASMLGENQDTEACMNFHFEIFRADGKVVRIVFDHTD